MSGDSVCRMVVSASPWCVPFCEFELGFEGISAAFRRKWRQQHAQMSSISLNITTRCPNTLHELCIRIVGASVWREHILIVRSNMSRHVSVGWATGRQHFKSDFARSTSSLHTCLLSVSTLCDFRAAIWNNSPKKNKNLKMIHFRFRVSRYYL